MSTTDTEVETENAVIGWATWKGDTFHGRAVHETKESLLVGYDLMSLRGLGACEESLYAHGIEACRTEATVGKVRPGVLYSIALKGRLVPYALEWSCLSTDPERTRESAAHLIEAYPDRVGVELTDLESDAMERYRSFDTLPGAPASARNKRQQKTLDGLRQRVLAAFQRHGIDVVPVAFKRLETPPAIRPFKCPEGWKVKKRFKVELDDLVEPHWFGITQLEVFAAMARTTWRPKDPVSGPFELLSASSCVNSSSIDPFTGEDWRKDLERRFRHILLHRTSGAAEEWREKNGIRLGNTFLVNGPTAEEIEPRRWDARGRRALRPDDKVDQLLSEQGWLAWSLNTCWPYATKIHAVYLRFGSGGASIGLEYGFPRDSSSWGRFLAAQKPGEPLIFTIERAQRRLDRLKDPTAKPPRLGHKGERARPAAEARDPHAKWDPPGWLQSFKWAREFNREVVCREDDF